jgi:PIN domain nuclease of toxin-antitoxin system
MTLYLLDTNILYWLRLEAERLPRKVIEQLEDNNNLVSYSVIAPWELTIKQAKGKLHIPQEFYSGLETLGFDCLPVLEEHIMALRALPPHHHDPFDRMLVAQAVAEKMTLITSDKRLTAYPIKTLIV